MDIKDISYRDEDEDPYFKIHRKIHEIGLKPQVAWLYCVIKDFANLTSRCWADRKKILDRAGISNTSFFEGLKILESHGMIRREKAYQTDQVVYVCTKPSAWIIEGATPPHGQACSPHGVATPPHGQAPYLREDNNLRKKTKKEEDPQSPSAHALDRSALTILEPEILKPKGKGRAVERKEPKTGEGLLNERNPVSEIWEAYAEEYGNRNKGPDGSPIKPARGARVNAICKRVLGLFGLEESLALVRFMWFSKDQWLVKNQWALESVSDAMWQSLRTQMLTGQKMTQTKAKMVDQQGAMGDVAQRAIERWNKKIQERDNNE